MGGIDAALLVPTIALVISMASIPYAIRWAPQLGMVDEPDPRKVHERPVPRVGGVGIVFGALIALVIALPFDRLMQAYVAGSLVLFFFGTWDDRAELGHYVKFIGQFVAVGLVVFYGDLVVVNFPFLAPHPLPYWIGAPFTFFALVGVINAVNHSDGLDGLAAGECLVSLSVVAFLCYDAGGSDALLLCLAAIGGILGFLRFNTHPAAVFMGDSGSQFIGFTLGFAVLLLTQRVNPALSPVLPALLLGLPVIDIVAVFYLRVSGGMNWFRATRNHIHHRLLDLGFSHQAAVVMIYSVHALLVITAILFPYSGDAFLLLCYLLVATAIFAVLTWAERMHAVRIETLSQIERLSSVVARVRQIVKIRKMSRMVVWNSLPLYLLITGFFSGGPDSDIAIGAAIVSVAAAIGLLRFTEPSALLTRFLIYTAIVFCVYLSAGYSQTASGKIVEITFFAALAIAIAFSLKLKGAAEFRTTPTDYLGVFVVLVFSLLPLPLVQGVSVIVLVIKAMVLLYASELILSEVENRRSVLEYAVFVGMAAIGVRGLFQLGAS